MNPLSKIWTNLKIIYLYVLYWCVGLEEEEFYIKKADYYIDLNKYHRAIRSYERALKYSNHPYIHSKLSYCYTQTGKYKNTAEYFRKVFNDIDNPKTALRLAREELESGNIDRSTDLIKKLKSMESTLTSSEKEKLMFLELSISSAEKGREDLKKYKKA